MRFVRIKKIEVISFTGHLYDLTVNPEHNFIANGILVHNSVGTPGRKVLEGERKIKVDHGENEIEINLEIEKIRMSGHADYNEILQFIKGIKDLKRIFLIHGEDQKDLRDNLEKNYEIVIPKLQESIEF